VGLLDVGRRHEHQGRLVGVVLHDLLDERADPDDRRVREDPRLRVRFERWITEIFLAHRPQLELLSGVVPVPLGGLLVDRDLVGATRVGHAAGGRREDVLVEEPAVCAAKCLEVVLEDRPAIRHLRHEEGDVGPRAHDLRQLLDLVERCLATVIRADPANVDDQRRRVLRAQEARVGRLRAAGAGDREEGQATDDGEQHGNAHQPEPVAGAPKLAPTCARSPSRPASGVGRRGARRRRDHLAAFVDDAAVAHLCDPSGGCRDVVVVGHHQDRLPAGVQAAEQLEHLLPALRVEGTGSARRRARALARWRAPERSRAAGAGRRTARRAPPSPCRRGRAGRASRGRESRAFRRFMPATIAGSATFSSTLMPRAG